MKQNKQKALERLREIEEEGNLVLDKYLGAFIDYKVHKIMFNLQDEAQKIKDDWKDDCGKKFVKDNCYNTYCGEEWNCPTCEKQNKEEKEICGRILG